MREDKGESSPGIYRTGGVMWREEDEALVNARAALERGDDVADVGIAVLFHRGVMLSLNLLGMEIWKLCDGRSAIGIVNELLPQFEVEAEVLRADVEAFLEELAGKGFISYEQ